MAVFFETSQSMRKTALPIQSIFIVFDLIIVFLDHCLCLKSAAVSREKII